MKDEPIYKHVKKDILNNINSGAYKSGDKIPSERELGVIYNVSRMTARQAVNELVNEGIVYREKGRGTYLSSPQFLQNNVKSFTETLKEQDYTPSTKILEFSMVHNLKDICSKMGCNLKDKFYKIKRLRLGNNIPIALETVYIPEYKCEGLKTYDMSKSLYKVLEDNYGYIVENVTCQIDATISNKIMISIFELSKPVALLKVTGITYTTTGDKLFYEESYYRPDIYKYHVNIYKRS
jgi:GntR family transcriptional regulator